MSEANPPSKLECENELSPDAIKKSNGDGGTKKPMQVLAPRCSNIQEPKPNDRNKTDVMGIAKDVTQRANQTTPPKVKQGGFINILNLPKSRERNFDVEVVESEKKKPPIKIQARDACGVYETQRRYIPKNLTSEAKIFKIDPNWDSKNVRGESTETRDVSNTGGPLATPKKNVPKLQPLSLNNQPGTSGFKIIKIDPNWDSKNVRGESTETRDVSNTGGPLATPKKNVPKLQPLSLNNQPGTSGSQILKINPAWDSKNVRGQSTETRDVSNTGGPLETPRKNVPKLQPLSLNNQPGTSGSQILKINPAWDSKNVRGQSIEARDVGNTGGLFATPKKNVPKKQLWPAGDSQNVNGLSTETLKLGNTGGLVDTQNENVSKPHPMPAWDAKTVLEQNTETRALGNTGGLFATPNNDVPKPHALPAWYANTVLGQRTETRNTSGVFTIPKTMIPKKQAGTEIFSSQTAGNSKNGHGHGTETPSVSTQGAAVGNTNAGAQNTKPPIFCKPYSIEEAKELMLKPALRSNQPARRTTRTYSVDTYSSFENRSYNSEIPQSSYWNRGLMLENASRPSHGGASGSQAYNWNQQHRKRPSDNEDVPPEVKRARYEEEQFQRRKANADRHRRSLKLLLRIINNDPPPPWHAASKMWLEVDELERLIEPFDEELKKRAQKAEEAKKAMEAEQAEMAAKAEKTEDANTTDWTNPKN